MLCQYSNIRSLESTYKFATQFAKLIFKIYELYRDVLQDSTDMNASVTADVTAPLLALVDNFNY